MSRCVALIPARGGSKGLPGKNIINLCGKPLLAYSIEAAQSSGVVEGIYVSSDDQKILEVAKAYGAVAFQRDPSLAKDDTPTHPVIEEFIRRENLANDDVIVLLQPTSPLRTSAHIQDALKHFYECEGSDALISVVEADNKYLYSFVIENSFLKSISESYSKIPRRQDLPSIYLPNGALYIFTVEKFMVNKTVPRQNIAAFVMEKKYSLDIDVHDDLVEAEKYLTLNSYSSESK